MIKLMNEIKDWVMGQYTMQKKHKIGACMLSLRFDLQNLGWKSMSLTLGVTDAHVVGSPLKITFWPIQK